MFYIISLMFALSLNGISSSVSKYPKWPANCSFTRYVGKYPLANHYTITSTTTETACESQCRGDTRCGMYRWSPAGDNKCYRFQHSARMWADAGLPIEDVLEGRSGTNTGSKECKEQVMSPECPNFIYHDRMRPTSGQITSVKNKADSLTADVCRALCNLYSLCDLAWHYRESDGLAGCNLYSTSNISVNGVDCFSKWIPCGTYERMCGATGASNTSLQPSKTSLPPTTSSLPSTKTSLFPTTPSLPPTTSSLPPSTAPSTFDTVALLSAVAASLGSLLLVSLCCLCYFKRRNSRSRRSPEPPHQTSSARPPLPPTPDPLYQPVQYTSDGYVEMLGADERRAKLAEQAGYFTTAASSDFSNTYEVPLEDDDGYLVTCNRPSSDT